VVAPAGTPGDVVAKLNAAINQGLRAPTLHEGLAKLGAEIKTGTPQGLGALLADELKKWAAVVKESGAAAD
jgi:tripartite-type tricarboxylate transporter receptor subunit TctC